MPLIGWSRFFLGGDFSYRLLFVGFVVVILARISKSYLFRTVCFAFDCIYLWPLWFSLYTDNLFDPFSLVTLFHHRLLVG
jgi:hypothetical protein